MTTAAPTRIFPHLQASYDEYAAVHASSGAAMAAALNAISRKVDADRAFLEAFQNLAGPAGQAGTAEPQGARPVTAEPKAEEPPPPSQSPQPPPLPPAWGALSDSAADDVEEWRAELSRRRQEALQREGT